MSSEVDEKVIEDTGEKLCTTCGSVMVTEEGKTICPHCDVKIDYFGEDDADDI